MDAVRKLIIAFFLTIVSSLVTIFVMIKGWGLEPQSWGIIVGGIFVGYILTVLASIANIQ